MGGFSFWHILILAIILLLLFGGNRFSAMMGDVAKGLKSFKQGMTDEDEEKRRYEEQRRSEPFRLSRAYRRTAGHVTSMMGVSSSDHPHRPHTPRTPAVRYPSSGHRNIRGHPLSACRRSRP